MKQNDIILIVDDVQSNIEVLGSILKDLYEIRAATSGAQALEIVLMNPMPDLILLDVEMPDMDGFGVLKRLKTDIRTKHIPVIFITGSNDVEKEEKALINGAVDYITKPIRPIIVRARINTHITLKNKEDELIYRASHDQLTGLYNRHKLSEEGLRIFSKSIRHNEKFCVVIVDIDHFKNVNDTYGHLVGDEVLKLIANLLQSNIRNEDFLVRYGGEEFLMIFDHCDIKDAIQKAELLRQRINALAPYGITVTASFGVARLADFHTNFELVLKDADDALYSAKEQGRNRVVEFKPVV